MWARPLMRTHSRTRECACARRKTSPAMRRKVFLSMRPRPERFGPGKPLACDRSACAERNSSYVGPLLHETVRPHAGCAFARMHDKISTGTAPRLFHWSPTPQGEDLTARSVKTGRLSERPQGASFVPSAEGRQILGRKCLAAPPFSADTLAGRPERVSGTMESHSRNGNSRMFRTRTASLCGSAPA